jgi:hypothetical protein
VAIDNIEPEDTSAETDELRAQITSLPYMDDYMSVQEFIDPADELIDDKDGDLVRSSKSCASHALRQIISLLMRFIFPKFTYPAFVSPMPGEIIRALGMYSITLCIQPLRPFVAEAPSFLHLLAHNPAVVPHSLYPHSGAAFTILVAKHNPSRL